jgi:hypothetical protein
MQFIFAGLPRLLLITIRTDTNAPSILNKHPTLKACVYAFTLVCTEEGGGDSKINAEYDFC